MKNKLKNKLKKYIVKHKVDYVVIDEKSILNVSFKELNPILGSRFLIIKNRETGRRIKKTINNKKCSIDIKEILDVNDKGYFDLYIESQIFTERVRKRVAYTEGIKLSDFVDEKNIYNIKTYKTVKGNISLKIEKTSINHTINSIKQIGKNFHVEGTISVLEGIKPTIAETILKRRDNKNIYGYRFKIEKSNEQNKYKFNGIIYTDKLREDLVTNSRWDVILQVRDDKNDVIYRKVMNVKEYGDFSREENRYLLKANDYESQVLVLYATMGKQSLALWYTDENQYEKTYNIAKGKSAFNHICENEEIDEKMVFFESFFGKNYSGNPKYIYEEMLRDEKYKDYKFIWSYRGENNDVIPGNPIIVDREDVEYYKYLARSKYWVNNIVFPVHRKREGNVYLQTWHGTPLKRIGFDIEIEGPETLARENFYIESRNWDYLISQNQHSSEIFKRAFKFHKDVLEYGYPLNDIFYDKELDEVVKEIKGSLNIPNDKKVILYAPTWRDNEMTNSWEHTFNLKFDLKTFYENFSDEYVLILRMHHLVADSIEIKEEYKDFVYELSKYDDIQELYAISDILITDYSSVFFDYANTKRPVLFFAYDFEMYKNNIRGFYLDMEKDLPGPVIKTEKELIEAINNIENISKEYKTKYDEFNNRFCYLDDGNVSKRIIDKVFN